MLQPGDVDLVGGLLDRAGVREADLADDGGQIVGDTDLATDVAGGACLRPGSVRSEGNP